MSQQENNTAPKRSKNKGKKSNNRSCVSPDWKVKGSNDYLLPSYQVRSYLFTSFHLDTFLDYSTNTWPALAIVISCLLDLFMSEKPLTRFSLICRGANISNQFRFQKERLTVYSSIWCWGWSRWKWFFRSHNSQGQGCSWFCKKERSWVLIFRAHCKKPDAMEYPFGLRPTLPSYLVDKLLNRILAAYIDNGVAAMTTMKNGGENLHKK